MKNFIHRDDIGDFEIPKRVEKDGNRYYVTPDGNHYPSITSVLSQQENLGLEAWKAKVGEKEAKRISRESAHLGTAVHQLAEFYLSNYIIKLENEDKKIVDTFNRLRFLLGNINNIVGLEIPLFSDVLRVAHFIKVLYCGSCDHAAREVLGSTANTAMGAHRASRPENTKRPSAFPMKHC